MKVALVNHGTAGEWGGGDSVQIVETAKRLRERGHTVTIQNSDRPGIAEVDIVHIFNCRVYSSFYQQVATAHAQGKRCVVSPIWVNIGKAMWGSRSTTAALQAAARNDLGYEKGLEMLKERKYVVEIEGKTLDASGNGSFDLSWIKSVGKILRGVQGLLPNSLLEMKEVQRDLNWIGSSFDIAPYGVDPSVFLNTNDREFREATGIKGDFILQVGRIEPGKNQAMLCWALRNKSVKVVLIGSSKHWPSYARLCQEIGGERVAIFDHMPPSMVASAYAGALVHCLPSWMETCGLVSLEAALCGTPVIGSSFGHELEYLGGDALLVDPADPELISECVMETIDRGKATLEVRNLRQRVLERFNWETAADATERLYTRVIENA